MDNEQEIKEEEIIKYEDIPMNFRNRNRYENEDYGG
jgi:hypothetical protein